MTTARLLTERPQVEFDEDGERILSRPLIVDLGVTIQALHEWRSDVVGTSERWTTTISVPAGFIYNGASIPALAHPIMGDKELYEAASVFHDALYGWQAPRGLADLVFWIVARSGSKQVTPVRAWCGWAALRIGGWVAYRARGRERV